MLLLTARWNVEQVYIQWAHVSLLLVSLSVQELVVGFFFLHATNTAYYSFPCKRSLANAVFPVLSKQPSKTQR